MEDGAYRFGDFSLFPAERRLSQGTRSLPLPPKAFDALLLFVRNHGRLVLRPDIVRALWPDIHVTETNLTNTIVLLRKILGRDAIQTVSKHGYRFTLPVVGEPGVQRTAYASFVRGKELAAERSLESILQARDLFWLCLAEDPHFAAAWAWLGRCCRMLEKFKGGPSINLDLAEAAFCRALAIDPDLACAHHFYTQLQADLGHAVQAMARLAARLKQHGEEPETFAGLVQVLRFCGLLDESIAAHERAIALDPTFITSAPHTYFLLGQYARVVEAHQGKRYYLDAAAWAAMGERDRAKTLLDERLTQPELSPLMSALMLSLLKILEGKGEDATRIMEHTQVLHEPEVWFYFARHFGMLGLATLCVQMLQRARLGGFTVPYSLQHDAAFGGIRDRPEFDREWNVTKDLEMHARETLQKAFGGNFLSVIRGGQDHAPTSLHGYQ
jgi:DNA-binding winged helix-turn-helix (wHTH) protein